MAFIGKEPSIGNFVKLDAISTSSTNTYNLTLDSVAFSPESPNHCMVSLNGVIQSPSTSFSISGSTITFIPSSGTLSSSDSIDFIMVYGNVLDLGVPSDATVTNAKTNFVSTSSAAGLQIKGDGTTDGTLQLNCSQNSHGIKLKSPPHSASASYTLTFPNNDGSSGEALTTDGSGVLTWATAGETNSPLVYVYATTGTTVANSTNTKITLDSEVVDSENLFSSSRFTVTSAHLGKYWVNWQYSCNMSTDGKTLNTKIYKNGSLYGDNYGQTGSTYGSNQTVISHLAMVVDLSTNGDYIEFYASHNHGDNRGTNTGGVTNATIFKIIGN